jgi:hypothetical protein
MPQAHLLVSLLLWNGCLGPLLVHLANHSLVLPCDGCFDGVVPWPVIYNVTESIFDWSDLVEKMGLRKFAKIFKIFEKKDDKTN